MNSYKYSFEKSPKAKGTCPKCKQNKKFRYYQDSEGNRLDEEFGKCDRINECGYKNSPFNKEIKTMTKIKSTKGSEYVNPKESIAESWENYLNNSTSPFHVFCSKIDIPLKHLENHGVGTDENGLTVFVLKNKAGKIVNCKKMKYHATGIRDKDFNAFSMTPEDKEKKYHTELFGIEQIDGKVDKKIIIVESEKTKVIASHFYPEYIWLSSASCNGVTNDKAKQLAGLNVIWLCDADTAGRIKNSSINNLQANVSQFAISDMFKDREDGYDIADDIIANLAQYQKVKTKPCIMDGILENQLFFIKPSVEYRDDYSMWVKTKNNYEIVARGFLILMKYKTVDEEENITWILELISKNGEKHFIEVLHDDLLSSKNIRIAVAKFRLSFKATDNHLLEILEVLFKQKFPDAIKVNRYGFHQDSKCYFFSNFVLTPKGELLQPGELGIVNSEEFHLCVPTASNKLKARFKLTDSGLDFNSWYQIYAETHTEEKAFIPMNFYIMSLFRDIILNHKGSSPILFLKGGAGTGKSSIVRSLTALFGFRQEDINLKSKNTEAALVKLMGQASNVMLWMDEYSNDFQHEGLLQAAYDNAGYHKTAEVSKSNSDTDSIEIRSALALTSNFIPKNLVFLSRLILLSIEETRKTEKQRELFTKLGFEESKGLGMITVELLKHRSLIESQYKGAFNKLNLALTERVKELEYPERLTSNIVQCMTCAYILQINNMITICESEDESDIIEFFMEQAMNCIAHQHQIQSNNSVVSEFLNILQSIYDVGQLKEDLHFKIKDQTILYLNLKAVYTLYSQKFKQTNHGSIPDKDSIMQEFLKIESQRKVKEIRKSIRFDILKKNNTIVNQPVCNSLSLTYANYVENFGIDFQRESFNKSFQ